MKSKQPTEVLFTAAEIAAITGVDESSLKGLEPSHFGSPGHWRMVGNNVVYTAAAAGDFAHELSRLGNLVAAQSLLVQVKAREVELKALEETPSRALIPAGRKSAEPYYTRDQYA